MRPAPSFPESNRTLTAPAGMDNCDPLLVWAGSDEVISAWVLEPGELEELQRNGGVVYLRVVTSAGTQPPVALQVASPWSKA